MVLWDDAVMIRRERDCAAWVLTVFVSAASACADPPGPGDAAVDGPFAVDVSPDSHAAGHEPIPLERFCVEYARAWCDSQFRCGCFAGTIVGTPDGGRDGGDPACLYDAETLCSQTGGPLSPEVRASIAAGRIVYDPRAARARIDRIESSCDLVTLYGETLRDASSYTLGGVLVGQLPIGAACRTVLYGDPIRFVSLPECAGGACGNSGCGVYVALGDACDANHFCVDPGAMLDPLGGSPTPLLRCARADANATSGTCAPLLADGMPCIDFEDCESGECPAATHRCRALSGPGSSCANDYDCLTHRCLIGTCGEAPALDGSDCQSGHDCRSQVCRDGVCLPSICL